MTSRGSFLIETMVGLVIAVVVMTGVTALITNISAVNTRNQGESLINQTYFQGVQIASNSTLFSKGNADFQPTAIGLTDNMKACLAANPVADASGNAFDCTTLDDQASRPDGSSLGNALGAKYASAVDQSYSLDGPCTPTDPLCMVRRTMTYNWVCPDPKFCTGLRLNVVSKSLASSKPLAGDMSLKPRSGRIFVPARQLMSKGEVTFTCASAPTNNFSIYKIDFVKLTDRGGCSPFDPGPPCQSPMVKYGQPNTGNCVAIQDIPCTDGFNVAGFFKMQDVGISGCGGGGPSTPINGACGSSASPSCASGSLANLTSTPPRAWQCVGTNGGTTAACQETITPVPGVCGAASGTTVSAAPTANLCATGAPTAVTTNATTFTWQCMNSTGTTGTNCSATKQTGGVWAYKMSGGSPMGLAGADPTGKPCSPIGSSMGVLANSMYNAQPAIVIFVCQ